MALNRDVLKFIEEWDQQFDNELFEGEEPFRILPGRIPVCVSAPHSVSQWRNGATKQNELSNHGSSQDGGSAIEIAGEFA